MLYGVPLFWLYLVAPSLLYGLAIPVLDAVCKFVSQILNDWENHRTEGAYRNALIAKCFTFRLANCFTLLYYYAFSGNHSAVKLSSQLASYMLTQLTWNQIAQTAVPWLMQKWSKYKARSTLDRIANGSTISAHRLRQARARAWKEAAMPEHDTFDDYAALMIQFGYVTFFSLAFPLVPGLALLNNILEVRSDAFALCYLKRRPVARKVRGIGVWLNVLQLMTAVAVLTNVAHIGFSTGFFATWFPGISGGAQLVIIFAFEHLVLALVLLLIVAIPSQSSAITQRKARDRFVRGQSVVR